MLPTDFYRRFRISGKNELFKETARSTRTNYEERRKLRIRRRIEEHQADIKLKKELNSYADE